MIEFIGYGSIDEVMDEMMKAEEKANAALLPCQLRMRDQRDTEVFWFRPEDDFEIYGHAWTDAMCHASSIAAGCTPDEAARETTSIIEARQRGYLFGKAFSVITPEGEIGSTHVVNAVPITKVVFELARFNEWSSRREVELADAIRAAVTHALQEGRA